MRAPYLLVAALFTCSTTATSELPSPESPRDQSIKKDSCSGPVAGSPKTWWRAAIDHNGTTPYSTDTTYQYYRSVIAYGADNTGVSDSSDAFNQAINAWKRTGNTVTTRPAYVFVPPGTYLIRKPIQLLVSTSLIGDALNPPILVADPALGSSGKGWQPVIFGYDDTQGPENTATKNFYMAVRNLRIDTTRIATDAPAKAIEWSVSQGCSLTNVHVIMAPASNHTGVAMTYGGSAVLMSDCSFAGGAVGVEVGSQQYLLKGLSFDGCTTGVYLKNSYVTTIQGATFANCRYGIDAGRQFSAGTLSVVDSSASKCEAGVLAYVSGTGQNSLVLDNFAVSDAVAVKTPDGGILLGGSVPAGKTWLMGNTSPYNYQRGAMYNTTRPVKLLSDGKYFTAPLPQYEKYDADQFVSVKGDAENPVYGDNRHDDGPTINAILRKHAGCKIVFFPQGVYQTQSTIEIPPGSRIVGEVFSTISAFGPFFSDADKPQPVVKVGSAGDRGVAQISDILVSAGDVLPGAILLQVHMAGDKPGDVGLWNVVLRVGGAVDTLVNTKCTGTDPGGCKAAFALLHVAKTASAYIEGVWGWVADHGLDAQLNSATTAQTIAVGRGALIESTAPTWLIGTAFEHCVLYQYALHKAANVLISLQQTESPYWQGAGTPHRAPAPWTAVPDPWGDPTFDNCAAQGQAGNDQCYRAWAVHVADSARVVVHGSALWVFFNRHDNDAQGDAQCLNTGGVCQLSMAAVRGAKGLFWYSVATKSAANVVYDTSGGGVNVTMQEDNKGAWGGVVAAYLRDTEGGGDGSDEGNGGGHGGGNGNGNGSGEGGGSRGDNGSGVGGTKKDTGAMLAPGWGLMSAVFGLFYIVWFLD